MDVWGRIATPVHILYHHCFGMQEFSPALQYWAKLPRPAKNASNARADRCTAVAEQSGEATAADLLDFAEALHP